MKRNAFVHSLQLDPAWEKILQEENARLQRLAENHGVHFATLDEPMPKPVGDSLDPYTGEFRAGYEHLNERVQQHLQAKAQFPDAKIEHDLHRRRQSELDQKIETLRSDIKRDSVRAGDGASRLTSPRIVAALGITGVILAAETLFNSMAFQVMGDSLLFSLALSVGLSTAVCVFSHVVPFVYKRCRTKLQRIAVAAGTLALAIGVFSIVALLRTQYLSAQGVSVSPVFFVGLNTFFFVVSAVASYLLLPGWEEMRQSWERHRLARATRKRERAITALQSEKEALAAAFAERTKERVHVVELSNHCAARIRKMYAQDVATFKRANLGNRKDHLKPDCFDAPVPEADIADIGYHPIPAKDQLP